MSTTKGSSSLFDSKPVKFLIAVGGIYTSYIYFGLITERLFREDYSGLNREKGTYQKFTFGFATSLFQNFLSFIIAALVNRIYYKKSKSSMDLKSELKIASFSFVSVFLASQALAYVSFPIQAIMKSSKIISILIVSLVLGSKQKFAKSQYLCGFLITAGIVLFNVSDNKGGKHGSGDSSTSIIGIIALVVSLFCDGLLGVTQNEVKEKCKPSPWDSMESLNKWGGIICLFVALVSGQFLGFIEFVKAHPAVITDLVLLALLGTLGQIFIFYTISNFSPLILSIITTTRKFFTVLVSIVMYNHPINTLQWASIALVFIGVFIEMLGGKKGHGGHKTPKVEQTPTQEDSTIGKSTLKETSKSMVNSKKTK
jgi:UDP-galactose transporter B1